MKHFAWAVWALGLALAAPAQIEAQEENRQAPLSGQETGVRQNYPNPFNPETTIPFVLNEELWEIEKPVVGLRIYNVLAQLVAIPLLQGTGEKLDELDMEWNGTGEYEAYWDGKVLDTGREAASGVYVYQLVVNGRSSGSRKMTIIK
ncbi:MAG: hypothetical protein V3U45_07635 [bacterium]